MVQILNRNLHHIKRPLKKYMQYMRMFYNVIASLTHWQVTWQRCCWDLRQLSVRSENAQIWELGGIFCLKHPMSSFWDQRTLNETMCNKLHTILAKYVYFLRTAKVMFSSLFGWFVSLFFYLSAALRENRWSAFHDKLDSFTVSHLGEAVWL